MQTDERNFRSTYYEKVGCRSVEERRSLEILLKDKPLSRLKLKQFCLRFTVPAVHRALLWNLLLGVAPIYSDSHEYVMAQRATVNEDLLRALRVLRIVDERTPAANVHHAMWLLETKRLKTGFSVTLAESPFIDVADVLTQISDSSVEVYWIAKGFFALTRDIAADRLRLHELTVALLVKHDAALHRHLTEHGILGHLPLADWFDRCFAGVLAKPALLRIWDRICGGSRKIVAFVCVVLLTVLRHRILPLHSGEQVVEMIETLRDNHETSEHIANKAIEMWQQNKDHTEFTVHRKDN